MIQKNKHSARHGEFKHKGGRPRLDDPRRNRVTTKLNNAELATVTQRVTGSGLTRSEIIRLMILHDNVPLKVFGGLDITAAKAYQNLQPLQSNLNQVARWFNETRPTNINIEGTKRIYQLCKAIEQEVKNLRNEIITKPAVPTQTQGE